MAKEDTPSKALVPSEEERRYSVGDAVRVRAGVIDPDFPDIPLAGWAGEIESIDETSPPLYLIRWSAETLSQITPAYTIRCEREGMDADETWLLGKDLEADTGGPLVIIAPQKLDPRPLDRDDSEDRVRAIFGLTSDDPLPEMDRTSLGRFLAHFTENLNLPQPAQFDDSPRHEFLVIQRLLPLTDDAEEEGILVEVIHEDKIETVPLFELSLLADYNIGDDVLAYGEWFVTAMPDESRPSPFPSVPSLPMYLGRVLLACLLIGSLFGAMLWAHESAVVMAQGGGVLCGLLGLMFGVRSETFLRRTFDRPPGFLIGLVFGAILGLICGAVVAVLALGFVGGVAGAILGGFVGQLLSVCGVLEHGTFRLTFLGAYLGVGTSAFLLDTEKAVAGCIYGFLGGAGAFLLGYGVLMWAVSRLPKL